MEISDGVRYPKTIRDEKSSLSHMAKKMFAWGQGQAKWV
jgi:hypothetical protein